VLYVFEIYNDVPSVGVLHGTPVIDFHYLSRYLHLYSFNFNLTGELTWSCSSRLKLTSTTSPVSVHLLPTVSVWAQDSLLQGKLH